MELRTELGEKLYGLLADAFGHPFDGITRYAQVPFEYAGHIETIAHSVGFHAHNIVRGDIMALIEKECGSLQHQLDVFPRDSQAYAECTGKIRAYSKMTVALGAFGEHHDAR